MTRNIIRSELRRALRNPLSWIGLLVGLVISFIPMLEEFRAMHQLGVAPVPPGEQDYANALNAWRVMNGRSGLAFVLPLLAMLPSGLSYCDDWVTGYGRFYVSRTQRQSYLLGKLAAALIAAFCVVFVLSALSAAIISLIYSPFDSRYDQQIMDGVYFSPSLANPSVAVPAKLYDWIRFGEWSGPVIYLIDAILTALSAAMYCAFGITISAFFPNRYVAFATPFVFGYIFSILMHLLSRNIRWLAFVNPTEWFQPVRLSMLPLPAVLGIGLLILGFWVALFWKLANRRMDNAL